MSDADQNVVNTTDRHNLFHGDTNFHDAATGLIWAENQVSLGAGEALMAKECFERLLWKLAAAEICHLHSDIGIFNNKFQTQSFLE